MSIIVKKGDDFQEFERLQNGTYQAVCIAVHDLGLQEKKWNNESKFVHQILILWEVNERIKTGEFANQRFLISKRYTKLLHEKSSLRKDLLSWRNKEFTEDELNGFDIETVIGANCLIGITNKEYAGKTYANITSISPVMKNMEKMESELGHGYKPKWVEDVQAKALSNNAQHVQEQFDGEIADPFKEDESIPF